MNQHPSRSKLAAIALFCALCASPLTAAEAELPKLIRQVEGVSEYALDNGLKVLLVPDPSQATVTVNVTYLVGSMHEGYGETGAAHLLEHMVFKGTPTHPKVPQALNDHGASWNGSTWLDRTNYFETMPASDENVEFGVCFEADRMVNSQVSGEDLDSEMTVVRNEWELGENDPRGVLFKRMQSVAYDWHGYGHSTIGARSDVEGVPIERLQRFYRTYYQPDNAVLVVSGRFDGKKALGAVVRCMGALPKPERTLPPMYTAEPAQDGERSVTLRRVGEIAAVGAAYHAPPAAHPDAAALEVVAELLGAESTGRLYQALVETDKATAVYAFTFNNRDPGLAWFFAELRKDQDVDEVRRILRQEVEGLASTEVGQEELETAKNAVLRRMRQLLNNSQRFAVNLSEWASMGDWRLFFVHRDRVAKVTAEDVVRVAGKYLVATNATIGTYVPTEQPTRVEVAKVSEAELEQVVESYASTAELADVGEEFEPTPENIQEHLKTLELDNGWILAALPKKTRGQRVVGQLRLHVGTEDELVPDKLHLNAAVAQMLDRGTTKRSREQIKRDLDRLQATVRIGGSRTTTRISIETVRANLPEVLDLVTEMLEEPAFDAEELAIYKREQLAQLEEARHEPLVLANLRLRHHLYPEGHLLYQPTVEEMIAHVKALTVEDLRSFHERYYGGGKGILTLVGDFDADAFFEQARAAFSGWEGPVEGEWIAPRYPGKVEPIDETIDTPDKENAMVVAGSKFPMEMDDPRYPALRLASYILGESQLDSRIATRLRQEEGISYGAWGSLATSEIGDDGGLSVAAILAPQNVALAKKALREELERLLAQGFGEEEFAKRQKSYVEDRRVVLANDQAVAGMINDFLLKGETFLWYRDWLEKIAAVKRDEAAAAVREAVSLDDVSWVAAYDVQKGAERGGGN